MSALISAHLGTDQAGRVLGELEAQPGQGPVDGTQLERCVVLVDEHHKRLLPPRARVGGRSEEHTSELQSLMRISYAVFCLKKKHNKINTVQTYQHNRCQNNYNTEYKSR